MRTNISSSSSTFSLPSIRLFIQKRRIAHLAILEYANWWRTPNRTEKSRAVTSRRVLGTGTVWSRNRFQNREPSTCLFLLIIIIGACKQTGSCCLVHRPIDLRSAIGKWKGAGTSLLSNLAHIEMLHNNKMRITFIVMAAPL